MTPVAQNLLHNFVGGKKEQKLWTFVIYKKTTQS
jgi:hypothetical protein